mmetsp:Transcript_9856/g.36757  ORF Transcript_9856/g.36757 Transcript_9856/m.36757 type:complete len:321 (+) Transcript_9856:89-1051(+)|eukprot:CAMPEP_0117450052 /NCGR_PEP_ID=MMETSP0759-20121206/8265_1 /TAXON_ID=63605 /ORGANISM="Percolomonas cosmopolitus, Strain WS" /LENGTH=320 /DNA_ID=CAMNT_0005242553 /DNA_START=78 /DNA_END=1040 /DNA_ORIENTATION=+
MLPTARHFSRKSPFSFLSHTIQRRNITGSLTWIAQDLKDKSPYSKTSFNRPRKFDFAEELQVDEGGLKKRRLAQEKRREKVKEEMDMAYSDTSLLSIGDLKRQVLYREMEGIDSKETVPGQISQIEYLQNIVPKFVEEVVKDKGCIYLKTSNRYMPFLQKFLFLHHNTQVKICSDITAVDYLYNKRFQMIYNLKSSVYNQQYFLKFWVGTDDFVLSSKELYPSALWFERETYDMFGVQFMGERETRRMLNDYGFKGHPLRKDFPLSGFTEVYYDSRTEELAYKPVSLVQRYRFYNRPGVWQSKRGTTTATKYDGSIPIED